jgi:hypothetical protein
MAKKHKKKTADRPAATPAPEPASAVEAAFAAGNYAAVKALARSDPSERGRKLIDLTRIDMVQVAVGLFAMTVVLIVAFFTLHS